MILADKIIKLRKQYGWSQEDLAEKMDVSRQSVSKWESANSIPDLNKILKLAEIFGVSTDFLLKDDIEEDANSPKTDQEPGVLKVTLEEAIEYIEEKVAASKLTALGVATVISSVIPLFALLSISDGQLLGIQVSESLATALGLVSLLIMVGIGVSILIKSSQTFGDFDKYENENIELVYGVDSILREKLNKYRPIYTRSVTIAVIMLITSVAPLLFAAILETYNSVVMAGLILLIAMVAMGVYIIIPPSTRFNAYNMFLKEGDYAPSRRELVKRTGRIAGIYWPLVTAIYLGWSLWTMNWGTTWVVWPVAGIAFAAIMGISNALSKDKS